MKYLFIFAMVALIVLTILIAAVNQSEKTVKSSLFVFAMVTLMVLSILAAAMDQLLLTLCLVAAIVASIVAYDRWSSSWS
jgi:hypothetical protein